MHLAKSCALSFSRITPVLASSMPASTVAKKTTLPTHTPRTDHSHSSRKEEGWVRTVSAIASPTPSWRIPPSSVCSCAAIQMLPTTVAIIALAVAASGMGLTGVEK